MDDETQSRARAADLRAGWLSGLGAYGLWGLVPFYFRAVGPIPPVELLAHRVVWSVVLLSGVLSVTGRWGDLRRCLTNGAVMRTLAASTALIAVNWLVFIYAVLGDQVLQTSLGYFIAPLMSVALGVVFFGEAMRAGRVAALALAAAGVTVLAVADGRPPVIALLLAITFSVYGMLRKTVAADSLVGLSVEVALLLPAAAAALACWAAQGVATFGAIDRKTDLLLIASGAVTCGPLLLFGHAARRLPLATLGFLQYLSPSIVFVLAVTVFGEPLDPPRLVSFGLIWAALAAYSVDVWLSMRIGAVAPTSLGGEARAADPAASEPPG